jgi:hypothetical protein
MSDAAKSQKDPGEPAPVPIWIIPVFLALAICFVMNLWGHVEEAPEPVTRAQPYLTTDSVRQPSLKPEVTIDSFTHKCNSCHQHFESPEPTRLDRQRELIAEHAEIKLQHGNNKHCQNCHHPKDRESFVDHVGQAIPYNKSEQLCGKCHGPKYRDWKLGLHGRRNGYWDESRGPSKRLTCVACHDPHWPTFKPIAPAPGPAHPFSNH